MCGLDFFFLNIYLFIFSCAESSLLQGLFSSSDEYGLLSSCRAQVSHGGGFSWCAAQYVGTQDQ